MLVIVIPIATAINLIFFLFAIIFAVKNIKGTPYFRFSVTIANNDKRFAKITNPPVFYNDKSKKTLFFKI